MAAYIVADVTVTDAAQWAIYREWATRAIEEHGAEILVRGGELEVLEGAWTPSRLVVLRFADRAAARAFYTGATYTQARKVREHAGVVRMVAVDGI